MKFLVNYSNRRLVWPDKKGYNRQKDIIIPYNKLKKHQLDLIHQRDTDRWDKLMERELIKILKQQNKTKMSRKRPMKVVKKQISDKAVGSQLE